LNAKYPQLFQQLSGINQTLTDAANNTGSFKSARMAAREPVFLQENAESELNGDPLLILNDDQGPGLDLVEERLRLMDNFVERVGEVFEDDGDNIVEAVPVNHRFERTIPVPTNGVRDGGDTRAPQPAPAEPEQPANGIVPDPFIEPTVAPKLGYAFINGVSVSLLMRVEQRSVVEDQASARTKLLAPMSGTLGVELAPTRLFSRTVTSATPTAKSPSGGKAPKLDEYSAKCAAMVATINKAKANVGRIATAAEQADKDFAAFAPQALQFADQLVHMVQQVDPLLAGSITMLELPMKYRTVLTKNVVDILTEAGVAPKLRDLIPNLFNIIDKAEATVKAVREHVSQAVDKAKGVSTAYKASFDHALQITAPVRTAFALGPTATTNTGVSAIVTAVQGRLDAASLMLTTLTSIGEGIFQHPEKIADPTTAFGKLDGLYGRLDPLVDATVAGVDQLGPLVDGLYTALADMHSDLQGFFTATKTVADLCRAAEAQVVSADVFRGFCTRINSAIAPFEGILADLHVSADNRPVLATPKLSSRVATSTPTTQQPQQPPKPVQPQPTTSTPSPTSASGPSAATVVKTANKALGGAPLDLVLSGLLEPMLLQALQNLLDKFIGITDLDAQLAQLSGSLQAPLTQHIEAFGTAVNKLVKAVEPKATTVVDSTNAVVVPSPSVLFDAASSKALEGIMKEIAAVVAVVPAPQRS
jgi:hypothetical protein